MSTAAQTLNRTTGAIPQLTLGWRLQMALSHGGVSVQEMADHLGMARSSLSRWLNDHGAAPRRVFIKEWADFTGVDFHWLETGKALHHEGEGPSNLSLLPHLDSNQKPAD